MFSRLLTKKEIHERPINSPEGFSDNKNEGSAQISRKDLIQLINRLVTTNERLKCELEDKSTQIFNAERSSEKISWKISELSYDKQKLLEVSGANKEIIGGLKKENAQLKVDADDIREKISKTKREEKVMTPPEVDDEQPGLPRGQLLGGR